ncbi:MAG: 1,4-alpha-glucan branching protein GlgB [Eubacteriaceae bacterium]|jgi:1,4-alpha-glucan branching enzyme
MNLQDFYTGKSFDAWTYFGAHQETEKGKKGWIFRTYAPSAKKVTLILTADTAVYPMVQDGQGGIWSVFVPGIQAGSSYLYAITGPDGRVVNHTDPYAFSALKRPEYDSVTADIDFSFSDAAWMKKRKLDYNEAVNIYEMHMGSWRRKEDNSFYSYSEIAEPLIDYLTEGGYSHVEFMPLSEHPVDESWGYQVSGFYSVTSRYGTPAELAELINTLHCHDIGVILDFVPVHFALDAYSLSEYDGTALYEYPSKDTGYSEWGSRNFNYYRGEVRSFLQSAADYWIDVYHADGLRMDAISNAIYWQGNKERGVNEGAVEFIQQMNLGLTKRHPDVMKIAEDSTSFLKVTAPVQYDGLGFDYKWDMGWMNDTLEFFKTDPLYRSREIGKLTWSMQYFYSELYILPLSHDEVVHGKHSILDKMPGSYEDKFTQARLLYLYMFTHPGKKLNFMGYEFGHFAEWSEQHQLDWNLLDYQTHHDLFNYIIALNQVYKSTPALYAEDYNSACFRFVDSDKGDVLAFERRAGGQRILVVFNFGGCAYQHVTLNLAEPLKLTEIFATTEHSGNEPTLLTDLTPVRVRYPQPAEEYRVEINLHPLAGILYLAEEQQTSQKPEKQQAGRQQGNQGSKTMQQAGSAGTADDDEE